MACGRRVQPRRCSPSAMAPLETSTQRLPSERSCAICAAQRAIAAASRPRPSLVTSEDPTLTTRVAAAAMGLACTAGLFPVFDIGEKRIYLTGQLSASLAVDCRDQIPGRLPAQRAHDPARARLGLCAAGQEIGLVEHQPARLVVERRVVFL